MWSHFAGAVHRRCEPSGTATRIAALSADQASTAIIGCPHMTTGHLEEYPLMVL